VIAARYNQFLKLVPDPSHLKIPGAQGVWNQYTIRITSDQGTDSTAVSYRDNVRCLLKQRGGSMIYYPDLYICKPGFKGLGYHNCQWRSKLCHEVLSLPMFPELSIEQQEKIIALRIA